MKPIMFEPSLVKKAFVKHPFLNEDFIHGEVLRAIQTNRINQTDKEHFTVTARRRTNGNYVKVIVWVHDRMDCYWIGKVHVTPL